MKLILISGKKGVGKSFTANSIVEQHYTEGKQNDPKTDFHIGIYSFAKQLKKRSNDLIEYLFSKKFLKPENKEIVRPIYQAVGLVGRKIDPEFWVDLTIKEAIREFDEVMIIDDVRFPNELDIKHEKITSILKIRITRESAIKGEDNDPSETAMNNVPDSAFDIVVDEFKAGADEYLKLMNFIYDKEVK